VAGLAGPLDRFAGELVECSGDAASVAEAFEWLALPIAAGAKPDVMAVADDPYSACRSHHPRPSSFVRNP
jgi:hypothetical protein